MILCTKFRLTYWNMSLHSTIAILYRWCSWSARNSFNNVPNASRFKYRLCCTIATFTGLRKHIYRSINANMKCPFFATHLALKSVLNFTNTSFISHQSLNNTTEWSVICSHSLTNLSCNTFISTTHTSWLINCAISRNTSARWWILSTL